MTGNGENAPKEAKGRLEMDKTAGKWPEMVMGRFAGGAEWRGVREIRSENDRAKLFF